jgi:uncharacterized metal-binding protein
VSKQTFSCAKCTLKLCYAGEVKENRLPSFCPMKKARKNVEKALEKYKDKKVFKMASAAAKVEKEGYLKWPRIREVAELAKTLNLSRIGMAFCIGLSREAELISNLLEEWGFEVSSVCCKCGNIDKSKLGLGAYKLRSGFEAACNPIVQAELLNAARTQLNIIVGLCVGHDALFARYSKAPVTTLVVKDRVTGHNPLAALYSAYHSKAISP